MKKILGVLTSLVIIGCNSGLEKKESAKKTSSYKQPGTKMLNSNWDELKKRHLRLLPTPKALEFTGQEIPADKITVVLSKKTEEGEIAANEISSRIKELTGKDIPILSEPAKGMYNVIIENKWPNTFTQDKSRSKKSSETEQGYGLYPQNNSMILAGQGKVGMMYAAVTLRWLVGKKDNKVILYPAKVIDWPDFESRLLASSYRFPYMEKHRGNPGKHLAEFKKYIDFLFRLKANQVGTHTYKPFQGAYSPFKKKPDAEEKILISIHKVNEYAKKRGIKAQITISEDLGKYPYQKSPELDKMFFMPWHNIYVSWARHDLHRKRAHRVATYCKAAGISLVKVHSPDGGGIRDPEMWSNRGALSKKMYPTDNDRAKADGDVFNIYAEELGKYGIETIFIQYPYGAGYVNVNDVIGYLGLPDTPAARASAEKLIAKIKCWIEKVNRIIPIKHSFCIRENTKSNTLNYYRLFRNRPFYVYYEVYLARRNIKSLLPKEISGMITSYDSSLPGKKQIMLSSYRGFAEPVFACAAEYSWNTGFPGWEYLDRKKYRPCQYNAKNLEIMAERAAVGLWGYEAGTELKKVFDRLLSIAFAVAPLDAQKRLNLKNMPESYKANHEALLRAEKALDKAWEMAQKAKSKNMPFMVLLRFVPQ